MFLVTKPAAEATDFSAQISQFSFLSSSSRSGLENGTPPVSHFSFLITNPGTARRRRLHISRFRFQNSQFWLQKGPLHIPNPLASRFSFRVSGFTLGLHSWYLRRAHFSIPVSRFSKGIKTRNCAHNILQILRNRLQMERGFDHYSAGKPARALVWEWRGGALGRARVNAWSVARRVS